MKQYRRLFFPSEGRRAEDFFALKIRRLRPGANQRTWVPKASTLPLDNRSRSVVAVATHNLSCLLSHFTICTTCGNCVHLYASENLKKKRKSKSISLKSLIVHNTFLNWNFCVHPSSVFMHSTCSAHTSVLYFITLTHCGRVTQICVLTLQLCRTGDTNLRF
jgi:hypothetical protein